MSKFELTIELDNAAFVDDDDAVVGAELAEVLQAVAAAVDGVTGVGDNAFVYDINGNRCGKWEVN